MAAPTAPAVRGRPRRADAERALLDAGRAQLDAEGYAQFSLERVAAAAGVGKATAYRRFRNKADLATAILADTAGPMPKSVGEIRADMIAYLVYVERSFGSVGLGVLGAILSEPDDPELMALHRQRVIVPKAQHARTLMEAAVLRGELRDDDDALRTARQMIVGALFARLLDGDRRARRRWAEGVVDVALGGTLTPPAPPRRRPATRPVPKRPVPKRPAPKRPAAR
jgi:AcrR family transcriptional regulator